MRSFCPRPDCKAAAARGTSRSRCDCSETHESAHCNAPGFPRQDDQLRGRHRHHVVPVDGRRPRDRAASVHSSSQLLPQCRSRRCPVSGPFSIHHSTILSEALQDCGTAHRGSSHANASSQRNLHGMAPNLEPHQSCTRQLSGLRPQNKTTLISGGFTEQLSGLVSRGTALRSHIHMSGNFSQSH